MEICFCCFTVCVCIFIVPKVLFIIDATCVFPQSAVRVLTRMLLRVCSNSRIFKLELVGLALRQFARYRPLSYLFCAGVAARV